MILCEIIVLISRSSLIQIFRLKYSGIKIFDIFKVLLIWIYYKKLFDKYTLNDVDIKLRERLNDNILGTKNIFSQQIFQIAF